MSGVRDRVNEAAWDLVRRLRSGDQSIYLDHCDEPLETIFDYLLGDDWRKDETPPRMIEPEAGTSVVDLAELTFKFADVRRITFHPDGQRAETDTTHTVMLGLIACSFAARYLKELDAGKVAIYALVHDLVEVHAGDTPTLRGLNGHEQAAKREREHRAFELIEAQFGDQFPWLPFAISEYEGQLDPEARYVKAMDKLMPKLTHILNGGSSLMGERMNAAELRQRYAQQLHEMKAYAADFPVLFELREQLIEMVFEAAF